MAKLFVPSLMVAALALVGCSSMERGPEGPPSPAPSASLNAEQQEAQQGVEEFFAAYDEALQDPDLTLDKLEATVDGAMRDKVIKLVKDSRKSGIHQSGAPEYELVAYRDTFEEKNERRLGFEICTDSSDIKAIDSKTGQPSTSVGAPVQFQVWRVLVAERDGWKVIDGTNQEAASCS